MAINLSEAIRRLRSILNEPAYPTLPGSTATSAYQRFFTDTELTDWINAGLRDVSRRAETLITYDTSIQIPAYGENPGAPVPTYALPTDVLRINRIEFQVARDSSQIYTVEASTQNQMDNFWAQDQLSTATAPSRWVTRGYPGGTGRNLFSIQLYPNPGQAGQLNIFYYRAPIFIKDPNQDASQYLVNLDIIEGWSDLVIMHALKSAYMKLRDQNSYQMTSDNYEQTITHLIDTSRQFNDQPQYFSYDNMSMGWGGNGGEGW